MFLRGVSWADYDRLLAIRGDGAGVRIAYLQGDVEIMSPSIDHEGIKKALARLLETYADVRDIDLNGFGSWTLTNAAQARGAEADECYMIGSGKSRPDIALEVIWTSGGLDKLEIYRGLGVREVWFWRSGAITVHELIGAGYVARPDSGVLPGLDLELLAAHVDPRRQVASVRAYRRALRAP